MTALLLGISLGLGLVLVVRGMRPRRLPLRRQLIHLRQVEPASLERGEEGSGLIKGLQRRFGSNLVELVSALGTDLDSPALGRDLRITEQSKGRLATQKVVWASLPLGLAVVLVVLTLFGLSLVPAVVIWCLLPVGVAGFFLPNARLQKTAGSLRQTFRNALSAYLDLVAISLAGGAEPIQAMTDGVRVSSGWAFDELSRPLLLAERMARKPWQDLGRLGDDLGIPELAELTSSLALADQQGASVRQSLAAKAESLRNRRITEAEGEANRAGEQMAIPIAMLGLGFVLFLGYPALVRVLHGLA